ncbi:MAG: pitrilysin family protein [Bacteroidota bacterium]|jgi:zinc protease|nr:MAG: peptidase M16 [Bacteroidota bacterium]
MLDRRTPPAFTSNLNFGLIQPKVAALRHGTPVYFIKGGEQNVLKIELVLPAGRWNESMPGVAHFSAKLLSRGTRSKDSFAIASGFDRLGAHFDVTAGPDFATVTLYSITRNLAPALELALEVLTEPTFPEEELAQLKSTFLQNLKISMEKTSYLASQHFRKTLFGEHHPYGRETRPDNVHALRRDDLVAFHDRWFRPMLVLVSGKVEDQHQQLILDTLSQLPGMQEPEKDHEPQPVGNRRGHVEKEGSLQTSLRIGRRAIPRSHPDYPALVLLNHVLGGHFGSRLMKNIREEKGLTYGIHSSIHVMKRDTYLLIGADVNRENTDIALEEVRKELERVCSEPIPADELEVGRRHFIGSLQSDLSTPFAHADKIRTMVLYNLPMDHYARLIQEIDRMSASDLLARAGTYFQKDTFIEVSAG